MTRMMLGTTEITQVQGSTYDVQDVKIMDEWDDLAMGHHEDLKRMQVRGSFELVFATESELTAFMSLLDSHTTNGVLSVSLRVNGSLRALEVFYAITMIREEDINSSNTYLRYSMEVTEK